MGIDKDDDDDDDDDDDAVGSSKSVRATSPARCVRTVFDLTDVERLLWYETVFYELDDDRHGGHVSASEALRVFLSFLTFEHSADEVDAAIYAADRREILTLRTTLMMRLSSRTAACRWEFIELCTQLLSRYPLPLLKMASSAVPSSQRRAA